MKYSSECFPSGIITALVTPFCGDEVDYEAFSALIKRQADAGAEAVLILGTTAEAATLSSLERSRLIECAVSEAASKLSVIVGCSSNDTQSTVELCKNAYTLGASGLLVVTPYYNKPSQRGILHHYLTVAEAVEAPIMLYNVPSRTGVSLEPETVELLFSHENIKALKEAGTDIADITQKLVMFGDKLYCGNDILLPFFCSLGARGAVSVCSNLCYGQFSEIFKLYSSFQATQAQEKYLALYPFLKSLTCDTNPSPIKSVMADFGLIEPYLRLPLVRVDEKKRTEILASALGAGIRI